MPYRADDDLFDQYLGEWERVNADKQRLDNYVRQIDAPVAERAAQIAGAHPHMTPGVVLAAAESGLDDDMVFALAEEEAAALAEDPLYRRATSAVGSAFMQTLRGGLSLLHGIWYGGVGRPVDSFLTTYRNRMAREGGGVMGELRTLASPIDFAREWRQTLAAAPATPLEQQIYAGIDRRPIDMRFTGETWNNFYQARDNMVTPGGYTADSVWALADQLGAGEYVEPGTNAHRFTKAVVDIGFEVATDPTLLAGKGAAVARAGQRVFGNLTEAQQSRMLGLVQGPRPTVLPEIQIDNWMNSVEGSNAVRWLAGTDDFLEIFNRVKNADAALALKDVDDEDSIRAIINVFAGREIRGPFTPPTRVRIGQRVENTRFARVWDQAQDLMPDMPNYARFGSWTPRWEGIPLSNPTEAVVQFERWMQNWRAPKSETSHLAWKLARATTNGNRHEAWGVFKEANELLGVELRRRGHNKDVVRSLTSIIGGPDFGTGTHQRAYWMELIADARTAAGDLDLEVLDGQTWHRHVSPHSVVELIDEAIMLPNLLEIRRATSALTRLQGIPTTGRSMRNDFYQAMFGLGKSIDGMPKGLAWNVHDGLWHMTTAVWMPFALVTRIAWPMRVVGEEQLRIGVSGLDGFNHPIHYLAWVMGNPKTSRISGAVGRLTGRSEQSILDLVGNPLNETREFQQAMVRNRPRAYGGPGTPRPGSTPWDVFDMQKGNPQQRVTAFRIGFGKMWQDDVKQKVAEAILAGDNQLDTVFDWFYGSDLHRGMMATSDKFSDLISTPQGTREWLKSQATELRQLSGNDTELIESVATREWGGVSLFTDRLDRKSINRLIARKIRDLEDAGVLHRRWVVPQDVISGTDLTSMFTRATNGLFYLLGAVPSNVLSRSPVFKQEYWREVARLMDFADYDTQIAAIAAARKAGIPQNLLNDIVGRARPQNRLPVTTKKAIQAAEEAGDVADIVGTTRILSMTEMDMLSKQWALERVNTLLYQLSERGQTMATMRLIFPFGEAWKEIGLTWSRLLATNPQYLRKGQIFLEGARQNGFLYTDPTTGEESFAWPGFNAIGQGMFGMDLPENTRLSATSNLQGLNLFSSSVIPGVGPTGNLILGATLPDNTEAWRDLRELVIPFGSQAYEPEDLIDPDTYLSTVLPAWIKKSYTAILEDGFDSRTWRSHVADSIRVLQASGEYGSSEEEIRRLSEDAESLARRTLWFRALGQAVLPTGYRVDFQARPDSPDAEAQMRAVLGDDVSFGRTDGGFLSMAVLTSFWHTLNTENGGDSYLTTQQFLSMFGTDPDNYDLYQWATSIGTGKTEPLTGRTGDPIGRMWEERHPELIEAIPAVIGYFAPVGDIDELDIAAFIREVETGDRYALSGEQFIIASQKIIGTAIWRETVRQTEGDNSSGARAFRANRQAWLDENFPYWRMDRPNVGVPQSYSQRQRIEQLEAAVLLEPVLATPAGEALNRYMKERNRALDAIQRGYDDVLNREQAQIALVRRVGTSQIRSTLRQRGEQIVAEVPEFGPIWTRILLNEVMDEEIDQ